MSRAPLGKHTVPGGLLEKLADPLPRDQVQPGNLTEQALSTGCVSSASTASSPEAPK